MFTIINNITKKPLRITYSNESQGSCYMTYDRPAFALEDENQYSVDYPIYMVANKETAEKVLAVQSDGLENMTHPSLVRGWVGDEPATYSVVELAVVSK